MTAVRLPSGDVPESEKRRYTESDVHSKLFEPDLAVLGYPPHSAIRGFYRRVGRTESPAQAASE